MPESPDGSGYAVDVMDSTLAVLAVGGAIVGLLGLITALVACQRAMRVSVELRTLARSVDTESSGFDQRAVRDLAVVRYDALKEMSGQLSFSIAMLNARGDGVVITSINGRSETRTYAKIVQSGHAEQSLSPEEDRAVRAARLGEGPVVMTTGTAGAPEREPEPQIKVVADRATA